MEYFTCIIGKTSHEAQEKFDKFVHKAVAEYGPNKEKIKLLEFRIDNYEKLLREKGL